MKQLILGLAFLGLTSLSFAQKKINYQAVPSLVKEAQEKGNVKLADSLAQDYINNYLFKLKNKELYSKENLNFIGSFLDDEKSRGFKLFIKEPEKVNEVLGYYSAQMYLMAYINKRYLPKDKEDVYKKIELAKWDSLEKIVVAKFGVLGKETVYGQRMVYHYVKEDWKNYGIWYQKYYEIGLKHSRIHVNNMSWLLFLHVDDPKILLFGCDVMKYAIENLSYNDWQALDTYANLLYKTGQREKAIEWEEKAVKLSNNYKLTVEALEKMHRSKSTWPEVITNP